MVSFRLCLPKPNQKTQSLWERGFLLFNLRCINILIEFPPPQLLRYYLADKKFNIPINRSEFIIRSVRSVVSGSELRMPTSWGQPPIRIVSILIGRSFKGKDKPGGCHDRKPLLQLLCVTTNTTHLISSFPL